MQLGKPTRTTLALIAWLALLGTACSSKQSKTERPDGQASSEDPLAETSEDEVLLEPYAAPTLETLDAQAEWVDQDVLDSMELLRERQQQEGLPSIAVAKALAMRNTSTESNRDMRLALGRLPENDSQVDYNAALTRHLAVDVKSTNPLMASSAAEFEVNSLTSFGLFGFDWKFRPFASTATVVSWQKSKDGMIDKVVMRDDLVWSDGQPITAHDIVFSFQTIMNPKVPVPAVRQGTDQLRWVEAYDDHTVVFFHREALATNTWNINFPIIPKHIYEKSIADDPTLQNSDYHVQQENHPISGGPYKIVRRERGQTVLLERREDFYLHQGKPVRPKPHFKTIRFRVVTDSNTALLALKKGDLEETQLNAEQWTAQTNDDEFYKRNTKISDTEWVSYHFCWNCKSVFFSDRRVRQAMSHAFDHEELLKKLCYDLYEPCTGTFHRQSWMYPKQNVPQPYHQDLDKAEDLLAQAGWEDSNGDGILDKQVAGRRQDFRFTILCGQTPRSIKICTLLKESLDQIGIICSVKPTEFTVLQQVSRDHKFHATFGGWGTGADPSTSKNIFATGENRNYGQYSNRRVDDLFYQGEREFDRDKRAEIYGQIHNQLWEDQPYTWLFYRNAFYGFNKRLRGYNFSPRGPYSYSPGFDAIWVPAAN